ncbi:hypothetical protein LTR86_007607 [Recurvomyces mirabilis]|nr:hypothetical protein LTR86_007607 [Recurvomyces mirabilis]
MASSMAFWSSLAAEVVDSLSPDMISGPSSRTPTSSTPLSTPTGTASAPFPLLDLPAELRTRIYTHALRHEENAGVIAPPYNVLGKPPTHQSVNGEWCEVKLLKDCKLSAAEEAQLLRDAAMRGLVNATCLDARISNKVDVPKLVLGVSAKELRKARATLEINTDIRLHRNSNGAMRLFDAHVCTLECLTQPNLTMVSKAVRQEALAMFYSCNRFEIRGLGGTRVEGDDVFWTSDAGSYARRWWCDIGDHNIRSIKHMYLSTSEADEIELRSTEHDGVAVAVCVQTKAGALRVMMAGARVEIAIRGAPENPNEDNEDASIGPQQTNPTRNMDFNGRSNAFEPWQTVSVTEPITSPYFSPIICEGYKRIAKDFTLGHACVQTIEEAVNGMRKLEHAMGTPERELALKAEWAREELRQEGETVSLRTHPFW